MSRVRQFLVCGLAALLAWKAVPASPKEELEKRGIQVSCQAFIAQIAGGMIDNVNLFFAAGFDVNCFQNDVTPLMVIATTERSDMLHFLLERGANIRASSRFDESRLSDRVKRDVKLYESYRRNARYGVTALHFAAMHNRQQNAALLLKRGADANARDSKGQTPLFVSSSVEIAKLLLVHEAQINARDNSGATVLGYARGSLIIAEATDKASESYQRLKAVIAFLESNGAKE